MKYKALIIMVAHKRKNGFGGDEMDDVMGASDITNLASVVVSYSRGKKDGSECTDDQRMLRLLKNRLFGKVNYDGWVMDFDIRSNRVYGSNDAPDREFGWTKFLDDGFEPAEDADLPWK